MSGPNKSVYVDQKLHDSDIYNKNGNSVITHPFPSRAYFPTIGSDGALYLALDTDILYSWDINTSSYAEFTIVSSYVNAIATSSKATGNRTYTKMTFVENTDTNSEFTNSRFTAKRRMVVSVVSTITITSTSPVITLHIYKNGLSFAKRQSNGGFVDVQSIIELQLNDYLEIYVYTSANATTTSPYPTLYISEIPSKGGK